MSIEYSLKQRKEGQGRAVLYLQPNGNKIYDNSMCHTALLHTQIENPWMFQCLFHRRKKERTPPLSSRCKIITKLLFPCDEIWAGNQSCTVHCPNKHANCLEQLKQIHVTAYTNPCINFDKSTREMIRNELGIRVVPHIIVRASMQIACCSLSRRREKLSTKSTQLLSSEENPVGNFCDQHQTCWWLWLQLRCFFCF